MNACLLVAATFCLAAPDDPLLAKLEAEYRDLLPEGPAAETLRKCERLLEQTDQSSHWTNYLAACRLARQTRSKAAVPLLLRYMVPHAHFGSTGSVDTYAETIRLLTGHDIGDPFAAAKSTTDRPAAVRAAVERLYSQWWLKEKDDLTTDLTQWSAPRLERYVDRLLKQSRSDEGHAPEGEPMTAYRVYHLIKYTLPRSAHPEERGWFAEELHACLTPVLLARAGYVQRPDVESRQRTASISYAVIGMLAHLRENGGAAELDEIAGDERQGSVARLTCTLALHGAGEELPTDTLVSVLESERRLAPRLTAAMALMLCDDPKAVGPTLLGLLDDPHLEIRAAAICALAGAKPPEALPKLAKLLTDSRLGRYRSFLLDTIAQYRGPEAVRITGVFLGMTLRDERYADDISNALAALEEASGKRWRAAGAHDQAYYRAKAEEALVWWRLRQEAIARQRATAQHAKLIEEYDGDVTLPGELLDAYASFVEVARRPTVEALRPLLLPDSVEIATAERSDDATHSGRSLNLPFLRSSFAPAILDVRQEGEDTILLRTATSYLRFVKTASGAWMIYDYGDKPIE